MALDASTWDHFAAMVERNFGLFSGCWCTWFHTQDREEDERNRPYKERVVREGVAHCKQYDQGVAVAPDYRPTGSPASTWTSAIVAVGLPRSPRSVRSS